MTPLILALDTTHEAGSLALVRGQETVEEVALRAPTGFSQVLYDAIARLLARHAIEVHTIDIFAAASGPGSFTGVRVGLACVKGLAEAVGRPAAAISNLRAMATFGAAPLRAPVMDARRGEIYGALYDAAGDIVMPETVAPLDFWRQSLPPDVEFLSMGVPGLEATVVPESLAAAIARLAGRPGEARDPAALDANYVRRSDAELLWKESY